MSTSTHSGLDVLEARLRELVGLLDGAQGDIAILERAWNACAAQGPAIEAAARDAANAAGEERKELREQLVRLVQLNDAARQAMRREQAAIAKSVECVRATRANLEHLEEAPTTGDSCDVSG